MAPKPLSDYPRPRQDNGRGVHWSAGLYHLSGKALAHWIDELKALQIKWVKLLDDGGASSLEVCQALIENDIMPIVRLYREQPNPGAVAGEQVGTLKKLIKAGVRYFETNNEPDLPAEWQKGQQPENWLEIVVDDFIKDADVIQGLGGYPAFPAMGSASTDNGIALVVARGRRDIFEKGAWLAIHNYTLNHPLDYPYDAVNQQGEPLTQEAYDDLARWQYSHLSWEELEKLELGISRADYEKFNRWTWDGRTLEQVNAVRKAHKNQGATLEDDANTFLSWQLWGEMSYKALGFHIPVISTEGGPVVGWGDDDRYARVTPFVQADWQMEIVRFMQDEAPDWYFTLCTWLLGSGTLGHINPTWEQMAWYSDVWNLQFGLSGQLPIVQRLKDTPAQLRHELRAADKRAAVTGQVSGKDGQALAGVEIALRQDDDLVVRTLSDETGHFSLTAAPGVYDLVVPWLGVVAHDITLEDADVDAIAVQAVDAPGHYKIWGQLFGLGGEPLAKTAVQLWRNGEMHAQTLTDAQGWFHFAPGLAGTYHLDAENAGAQVTLSAQTPEVQQNLNADPGPNQRYILTEKRLLTADETGNRKLFFGMVTDMTGAGLSGIQLEMRWQNAAADTEFPRTKTGDNPYKPQGYYEFLHSPGVFEVSVVQGDFPSDVATQLVTDTVPGREGDNISYEINFQLQAMGQDVRAGVIKGSVPGGRAEQVVRLWQEGQILAETELDHARTFQFTHLAQGFYDLELAGIGMVLFDIASDGRHHQRITFPLMGAIKGRVTGADDKHSSIKLISETYGFTRQGELTQDGHYRFTRLPQGRYRIELHDDLLTGLVLEGPEVLEAPLLRVGAGIDARASTISGKVHDAAHRPTPDVRVTLYFQGQVQKGVTSDAHGQYHFDALPAGVYEVRIGDEVRVNDIVLDGDNQVTVNLLYAPILAAAPLKQLQRYYLLQMADLSLLPGLIRLLGPWLATQPAGTVGFSLTAAQQAETVVLLGDGLPDSVMALLQEAECDVIDMRSDLRTLATILGQKGSVYND